MNTSQKSYVEIYQSLHPVAKQLVEIFAYACCPLDYFDLYVAVRETDRSINSTKYNRALNSLCQRLQALQFTKHDFTRVYTLDPEFSLHVLVELEKDNRDLEDEIPHSLFWNKINRTGKNTREALIRYCQGKTLPDPAALVEENNYAGKLLPVAIHVEAFNGIEKILPPDDLVKEVCNGVLRRVEAMIPPRFIDSWFERFSALHADNSSYQGTLREYHDLYSFLTTGHREKLPAPGSFYTRAGYYLEATSELYEGDIYHSIVHFNRGIERESVKLYGTRPHFPLFDYAYTVALLSDHEYADSWHYQRLERKRTLDRSPHLLSRLLLAITRKDDPRSVKWILDTKPAPEPDSITGMLVNTILRKYDMSPPKDMKRDKTLLKRLAGTGWKLVLLECYATHPDTRLEYENLSRELGKTALITREFPNYNT